MLSNLQCFFIQANLRNITGNYKGDGWQNGGLIIVSAGGEKLLFSFKQKSPGDHVDNEVILNALGITSSAVGGAEGETPSGEEGCGPPDGGGC